MLKVPAAAALDIQSPALEGLTIVVDAADPAAVGALSALATAGAEAGVVMALDAPAPHELLARAHVVIVRNLRDDDASVFRLRTLATTARSARAGVRILAAGSAIPARAAAYVDGRLDVGPVLVEPDAGALVRASRAGGSDPVLLDLFAVEWSALAALASQRAVATEVVASAPLTADAIVARHQAQRRRQERLVRRTIGRGSTSLLFEVPGFVAPVTVTARTTIYQQPGLTELEQREIRVNGAAVAGGGAASPPQLPLIEPERVAAPPLAIALNDRYAYTLDRRQRLDGADAYVVRFEPRDDAAPAGGRVQGRAWIDARTFALRRLETVQAGLRGAIVSSEQHEEFGPFDIGSERVWLPVKVQVYQVYEGAGHRTPIHRTIETPSYDINPEDFDARLKAAYASPHVMLRDTPQGLRYLLREPRGREEGSRMVAARAGERIRAAVFGVVVDPNITRPLPFAGLSYVDLNLFGRGGQLNAFLGGSYGQLSWSVPALGQSPWRLHGRAFAIAARYNDRAFRAGVEQYRANITQRPAHLSVGAERPLARRLRARFAYELDYTAFDRADTTAPEFVVPPDALVHGLVSTVEAHVGPWTLRAWWNPALRQRWAPWGEADREPEPAFEDARTFQRYGAGVGRTIALGRAVASRLEAAWTDGTDLDRFSRYSFGAFENRLRGYPTASIRYDRGGVLRSVTTVAGRGFRIDAFGDLAAVRDPGFGPRLRPYPGVGAALEAGGPFRTLVSVEWGYGFRARRSDGAVGTQAWRISAYRTF